MKYLSILMLILTFSACKSDEERFYDFTIKQAKIDKSSNPQERIIDGIIEPKFPSEEVNIKTLEGLDTNLNGIRDDIEIYINYNFKTSSLNFRNALRQFALVNNLYLRSDPLNDESTKEIFIEVYKSNRCLSFVNPRTGNTAFELHRMIFNNEMRKGVLDLRIKRLGNFDVKRTTVSVEEAKSYCRFDVRNLDEVIKNYEELILNIKK